MGVLSMFSLQYLGFFVWFVSSSEPWKLLVRSSVNKGVTSRLMRASVCRCIMLNAEHRKIGSNTSLHKAYLITINTNKYLNVSV